MTTHSHKIVIGDQTMDTSALREDLQHEIFLLEQQIKQVKHQISPGLIQLKHFKSLIKRRKAILDWLETQLSA